MANVRITQRHPTIRDLERGRDTSNRHSSVGRTKPQRRRLLLPSWLHVALERALRHPRRPQGPGLLPMDARDRHVRVALHTLALGQANQWGWGQTQDSKVDDLRQESVTLSHREELVGSSLVRLRADSENRGVPWRGRRGTTKERRSDCAGLPADEEVRPELEWRTEEGQCTRCC